MHAAMVAATPCNASRTGEETGDLECAIMAGGRLVERDHDKSALVHGESTTDLHVSCQTDPAVIRAALSKP
jgi:hypothetical protein